MPDAAQIDFAGSNVIHEFEDGWKIIDLRSDADLDAFGKAMRNCWTATGYGHWNAKILPGPEGEKSDHAERARARWDRPEYRKTYGDEWVEIRIENDTKNPESGRFYKLIAIVDAEGNLSAGASLGLKDLPNITYGGCDGLHQKRASWINLDGFDFCMLELLPYTGVGSYGYNVVGETLDHVVEWWKSICAGEWQEDEFARCREAAETKKVKAYA